MLLLSTSLFAQWQVGLDLWRLPTKTLDVGANYFFGKKYFVSIRTGYSANKNARTLFTEGNMERSSITGYFLATGLGVTFPSKKESFAYWGMEVMGDIGTREYVYEFGGSYGTYEVAVVKDFKTIGGNLYFGANVPLSGNLFFDPQIRVNVLASNLKYGDRLVAPSIGRDKVSGDPAFAVNVNFVMKLVYRFSNAEKGQQVLP